ncbi:MAG: hypothetical protein AAF518_24420 [Spirochaetota bacterium]
MPQGKAVLDRLSIIMSKLSKYEFSERNRKRYDDLAQRQIRFLQLFFIN